METRETRYYHYYEFPKPYHVPPHFGLTTERYRLIRFYKGKQVWEFYDLEKDPNALHNIYDDQTYEQTLAQLKWTLKELVKRYEDKAAAAILRL